MTHPDALRTERLLLRRFRPSDRAPFAALNADPRVTAHLPAALTAAESDAVVDHIEAMAARDAIAPWAVERLDDGAFLGFVGLARPTFETAFTPCVEVAWRLAAEHWGRGYATEAARASLADGFGRLGLAEILSWTTAENRPSWRVMERLGMRRAPELDFDHPKVALGHRLRPHIVYRLGRDGVP